MRPDTARRVLDDYRAKKATSATELARLHGVSRSAVYRLLQQKKGGTEVATEQIPKNTFVSSRGEESRRSSVSDGSAGSDSSGATFEGKVGRFADDLGLPDQSGQLENTEPDEKDTELKEAALDAMMGHITGETPGLRLPPGLEAALEAPMMPGVSVAQQQPTRKSLVIPSQGVLVDRASLTQKVIFNVQHFATHLEPIIGTSKEAFIATLSGLSDAELKDTLNTLERTRSVGNMASGFKQVFYVAAQATEATSRLIGMRARGFADHLRTQDEEITMIMKELAIDQWEKVKMLDSPQARLGVIFCMTLVQVDAKNRITDQMAAAATAHSVNPSLAERNKDL